MKTKKITLISLLTAMALTIFVIEAQIPPPVPIPGVKLGLANVITLLAIAALGKKEAFTITILRVLLGSLYSSGFISLLYSLSGGLVCFTLMCASYRILSSDLLHAVSIIGAIGHNIGQILVAWLLTKTNQIILYFPVLMISGIITGFFTGTLAKCVLVHSGKLIKKSPPETER